MLTFKNLENFQLQKLGTQNSILKPKKFSGERKESWLPHQCSDQLSGNHFPSARRKAITVLEVVNLSGGLNHQTVDTTVS